MLFLCLSAIIQSEQLRNNMKSNLGRRNSKGDSIPSLSCSTSAEVFLLEQDMEEWRDIPNWEGLYQASSYGKARSLDRVVTHRNGFKQHIWARTLKQKTQNGYKIVTLSKNGICKQIRVHILVLSTFQGERPPGLISRHLDGVRANNYNSNLRWGTYSENTKDRKKHGRWNLPKGVDCYRSKLTEEQVLQIRIWFSSKTHTMRELSEIFNMNTGSIYQIVHRQTWKHI